jgi:site-specific recombinase XerD
LPSLLTFMAAKIDIHNYDGQLERTFRHLEQSSLSRRNIDFIRKYAEHLLLNNIGKARVLKYVSTLKLIAEQLQRDFDAATADDFKQFLLRIHNRKDYSIWTKFDYNVTIKKFYKWLEGKNQFYPEKVAWIKTTVKKKDKPRIKKAELLSEEEVHKLLEAAPHAREKALIALLWDTGARIGEIGGMTLKHVSFEDNATYVDLVGKTGSRTCMSIEATPFLVRWLDAHPLKDKPNAPLWLGREGEPLGYAALAKVIRRVFERAEIKKHFNPHLFRHSRATWCAEQGWSTYEMCKHFGWELDSGMPAVYISLVDKDVHNKMRESYGIQTDRAEKIEARKPQNCPRCTIMNEAKAQFCYKCGMALDTRAMLKLEQKRSAADTLMLKLLAHPDLKTAIVKKLKETKLDQELKRILGGEEA